MKRRVEPIEGGLTQLLFCAFVRFQCSCVWFVSDALLHVAWVEVVLAGGQAERDILAAVQRTLHTLHHLIACSCDSTALRSSPVTEPSLHETPSNPLGTQLGAGKQSSQRLSSLSNSPTHKTRRVFIRTQRAPPPAPKHPGTASHFRQTPLHCTNTQHVTQLYKYNKPHSTAASGATRCRHKWFCPKCFCPTARPLAAPGAPSLAVGV